MISMDWLCTFTVFSVLHAIPFACTCTQVGVVVAVFDMLLRALHIIVLHRLDSIYKHGIPNCMHTTIRMYEH